MRHHQGKNALDDRFISIKKFYSRSSHSTLCMTEASIYYTVDVTIFSIEFLHKEPFSDETSHPRSIWNDHRRQRDI